jgi:hypothetical protein
MDAVYMEAISVLFTLTARDSFNPLFSTFCFAKQEVWASIFQQLFLDKKAKKAGLS